MTTLEEIARIAKGLSECFDFMREVVGLNLTPTGPLPDDYDWRRSTAIECANAMMEYDQ